MAKECIVAGCGAGATTVHKMCKLHGARFSVARSNYRRSSGGEITAEEWAANGGSIRMHLALKEAPEGTLAALDRVDDEVKMADPAAPDLTDRLVDACLHSVNWLALPAALKRRIVGLCLDALD